MIGRLLRVLPALIVSMSPLAAQQRPQPAPAAPQAPSAPQVPAAVPAPTPAPPQAQTRHALAGAWRVTWPTRANVTNALTIDSVSAVQGAVNVVGRVAADNGETCAVTGSVFDEFIGQFRDGLDMRTMSLAALVRLRLHCANDETWIEAFGLPGGPILMIGRATTIARDGTRSHQPVHLVR